MTYEFVGQASYVHFASLLCSRAMHGSKFTESRTFE